MFVTLKECLFLVLMFLLLYHLGCNFFAMLIFSIIVVLLVPCALQ